MPDYPIEQFRVPPGKRLRLSDHRTDWLPDGARQVPKDEMKARALEILTDARAGLDELQQQLYAEDRSALLLVFQAMDAAGKDSTIRHVMSGVNPQGCHVHSFKAPNSEELAHDWLWRCTRALPERGKIGIFNRSHYEEVLVVRVNPGHLAGQGIDPKKATRTFWKRRYQHIANWEDNLEDNRTHIVKFFLHVSKDEQRKRFLSRIEDPKKNWKFNAADITERERWDEYQGAYRDAIEATSTDRSPWYIIPADRKSVARALVARIAYEELRAMHPKWPAVSAEQRAQLETARQQLKG